MGIENIKSGGQIFSIEGTKPNKIGKTHNSINTPPTTDTSRQAANENKILNTTDWGEDSRIAVLKDAVNEANEELKAAMKNGTDEEVEEARNKLDLANSNLYIAQKELEEEEAKIEQSDEISGAEIQELNNDEQDVNNIPASTEKADNPDDDKNKKLLNDLVNNNQKFFNMSGLNLTPEQQTQFMQKALDFVENGYQQLADNGASSAEAWNTMKDSLHDYLNTELEKMGGRGTATFLKDMDTILDNKSDEVSTKLQQNTDNKRIGNLEKLGYTREEAALRSDEYMAKFKDLYAKTENKQITNDEFNAEYTRLSQELYSPKTSDTKKTQDNPTAPQAPKTNDVQETNTNVESDNKVNKENKEIISIVKTESGTEYIEYDYGDSKRYFKPERDDKGNIKFGENGNPVNSFIENNALKLGTSRDKIAGRTPVNNSGEAQNIKQKPAANQTQVSEPAAVNESKPVENNETSSVQNTSTQKGSTGSTPGKSLKTTDEVNAYKESIGKKIKLTDEQKSKMVSIQRTINNNDFKCADGSDFILNDDVIKDIQKFVKEHKGQKIDRNELSMFISDNFTKTLDNLPNGTYDNLGNNPVAKLNNFSNQIIMNRKFFES